ncbi:HD domain-containing protein [Texcoconibacillus texcoconensis]|uniref:HD domain-containing protein n=1 Tax=Texcoconibacillus texcoconensis TaxID=1095777 RepID=A0A840QTG5_9BACI|nr:HD domain-containing protein [Texcoconibacillus texcoconensis]MBB5174836.1 uncharacterized protein [Texcoconibacillus texcoconensis]
MKRLRLREIYEHPITKKYVKRSGLAHAIATAEIAFELSKTYNVSPDLATKAAFLHDIGHYTWYKDGQWDYELYKENDIHAIKGAERSHKLLIRLGEDRVAAKQISLAILLHTDSYLPTSSIEREPLQEVVASADEQDEEPGGFHHYRKITESEAIRRLTNLDEKIDQYKVNGKEHLPVK